MKVLFVSSGNKKDGISPIVRNQGESLRRAGMNIDYFTVTGKGWWGYVKHWLPLMNVLRRNQYDLIHAHYSLCGFIATLAAPTGIPIIVSLMGTFRKKTLKYNLVRFLAKNRWKNVIVKSARMKAQIGIDKAYIIPNGVNVNRFILQESRSRLREEFGFAAKEKIIIFVSNPERTEKNFSLCQASVNLVERNDVRLIVVHNCTNEEVAKYMLAADVLMLTSFTEGSPNVIKEAMAANCPIVSTNVGDVDQLLKDIPGTYIMQTFQPEEGAELLTKALNFDKRTDSLDRLILLGLSDIEVANKIIKIYHGAK